MYIRDDIVIVSIKIYNQDRWRLITLSEMTYYYTRQERTVVVRRRL